VRTYRLCLIGFGNVGKALARLLVERTDRPREEFGIAWKVTGVASGDCAVTAAAAPAATSAASGRAARYIRPIGTPLFLNTLSSQSKLPGGSCQEYTYHAGELEGTS